MKKNIPYLIIIAICVLITVTVTVVACSTSRANDPAVSDTESTQEATATETVSLPTHNSPTETTEAETTERVTTATEEETEPVTEPPETENSIVATEEFPPVEDETEPENVTTEEPEMPETAEPVISLEYLSMGNGTCSVIGIGSVTDTYIVIPERSPDGDVVTAIEEDAFFGNQTLRAVEIPSTVATIGDRAFADCPELVYVSVDKSNRLFTDVGGVLYSIDMTTLLCYPSANGASSITIPVTVTKISPVAFYGCDNLKIVYFEGTLEVWSKMSIGEMNYGLYTASILCSDMQNK